MADNQVVKVFPATMASGGTLTGAIDLRQGWREVSLQIPSFPSAADIYLHASTEAAGTYTRITFPPVNSGTAEINDFEIASGLGARMIPIPANYQHLKIEVSTALADGAFFSIVCKS